MFRTCGASAWEVEKATMHACLLSGRYRVEVLTCQWVPWNSHGMYTLPECWNTAESHRVTVEAFLLSCTSLFTVRMDLATYNLTYLQANPDLAPIVDICLHEDPVQFWLDYITMVQVIAAVQPQGEGRCPIQVDKKLLFWPAQSKDGSVSK